MIIENFESNTRKVKRSTQIHYCQNLTSLKVDRISCIPETYISYQIQFVWTCENKVVDVYVCTCAKKYFYLPMCKQKHLCLHMCAQFTFPPGFPGGNNLRVKNACMENVSLRDTNTTKRLVKSLDVLVQLWSSLRTTYVTR